jgi:hypothetical protein
MASVLLPSAVVLIAFILILASAITPLHVFAKDTSNNGKEAGGGTNDNGNKNDGNNKNDNRKNGQQPPETQPSSGVVTPGYQTEPHPKASDCTINPKDPSCPPPSRPKLETPPPDCNVNPKDSLCSPAKDTPNNGKGAGGGTNDNGNKNDGNNKNDNRKNGQQPPETQPSSGAVDCSKTPSDPTCRQQQNQKQRPPEPNCTYQHKDPLCNGKKGRDGLPFCDLTNAGSCYDRFDNHDDYCRHFSKDPTCKRAPKPDGSCKFFPEKTKCAPDPVTGKCPDSFFMNGDGHCVPNGKCPKGFENHDNDESGTCWQKHVNPPPSFRCPPGTHRVDQRCIINCPPGFHPKDGICAKVIIIVHKNTITKHVNSNTDENSMVTTNTQITDELTVGEAIDGCKEISSKNPNNELKKSCNILMAAIFNYCQTHTKLWYKDSNICSDDLYLKNVPQYIAENINLKLFPATIYNIRP